METSEFSAKELLANCNGINCYDFAEEKLYVSFQIKPITLYPVVDVLLSVADLGGVPRVPWNPPFGFSDDRRLWKPGI